MATKLATNLCQATVLAAFVALHCAHLAQGHGYLKSPISRNYAARLNNRFYCEHCGQGNGAPVSPQANQLIVCVKMT